ncbi:MAG: hypothetical protein ACREK8_06050 [Gemmatimonadales bacterium]
MRQRTEAIAAMAALAILATLAAALGHSRQAATDTTADPSTFLAGPGGSRGLLEALQHLGIGVRRFRDRSVKLPELGERSGRVIAVLDPSVPISEPEVLALVRASASNDLLVAGQHAELLMKCFGYGVKRHVFDSVRAGGASPRAPLVAAELIATKAGVFTDSSRSFDVGNATCRVPAYRDVTTLLASPKGPVVIRLVRADNGRSIILAGDAVLFENRALRDTDAGPLVLGLFVGHDDQVVFDEYHHGFGPSGSLAAATIRWSFSSPWGWAVWQLVAVGLLALLFGAVRFGPARTGIIRHRRSQLEHVRALATALAAARGHDEAVAAMIRGLRRRLVPAPLRTRGDWRRWLRQLGEHATSPEERHAVTDLESFTTPGQSPDDVRRAANAVEDLWNTLRH